MDNFFTSKDFKLFLSIIAGGFVFLVVYGSMHAVPAGHKGVESLFGKVNERVLDEGLHFLNPLSEVRDIDLREQREEMAMSTYTKDIQLAQLKVVFTFNLNGENVQKLFRTVGVNYRDKLITPILQNATKDIVGKWEADKLIENRNKAINDMSTLLTESLNKEFIQFGSFSLIEITYSESFEKSIEEKQIATQNAIKAKNNTVRISEEAKQKVISAEAEAKSIRIRSQALSVNKGLIEYEAIQKWDGKLPTYTGSGAIPFINIDKK
jgi:prohibitin 2